MTNRCDGFPCFDVLQLSLQSDWNNNNIFFKENRGETFAIKKLGLNCNGISTEEQHWEKLIKLRYDHLVRYYQNAAHQDTRYMVMELCQGSMLDYCRGSLDENIASLIKGIDIMWHVTCGVDYLHRHQIDYGHLKLENVLFWKRDSKSKRVVVKITGYGYKDCPSQDNVKSRLGTLYYAAATKEEVVPNKPITSESLTEIDEKHRDVALEFIRLLTKDDSSDLAVTSLLLHPVFTRWSEEGRSRLIKELQKEETEQRVWRSKETLEEWKKSLDKNEFGDEAFGDEAFGDFNDIMLADHEDVTTMVGQAFKTTPVLFSKYIWHIAPSFTISKNNAKCRTIQILGDLGSGSFGEVSKCNYTDESGKTYLAACKKCIPKNADAVDVFDREDQTLCQLNHLFVVKYLDLVENQSKRYIVMELCEGSLKDYVEGNLKRIPKDSLDDKILISQVALGIAYIHSKDIIHKDLKPANILLCWCQPSNYRLVFAKIADFGFAKELKPGQTEFSDTVHPGTANYRSPEVLNAKGSAYPASFANDVYAFGITIAEIVNKGDHPFSSADKNLVTFFMAQGLAPQNLQDLSWDLKDLILQLTDKDPGKRPKMALVLRHPYFVLTNNRTIKYFTYQLWADIGLLSQNDGIKAVTQIFSSQSLEEWYRDLSDQKQYTDEEKKRNEDVFKFFQGLKPDILEDIIHPEIKYAQDINENITSEYDAIVGSKIDQRNSMQSHSRYSLYKLVQRSPKFLVPYLWSHLHNVISLTKPSVSSAKDEQHTAKDEQHNPARMNHPVISEIEWSSLFCEEQFIDGLWSVKYWDQSNMFLGTEQEIIGLVAKCNMTERVWSAILDQLGNQSATSLLLEIVQSSADNGPKLTEMLLDRYGFNQELSLLYWAASNEGDQAAEIVQVLLKYGVDPNVVGSGGATPIHVAAGNESSSAPKIIKVLLEAGADPYARATQNDSTPFQWAALNRGDCADEIMEQMLDKCTPNENELNELLKLAVSNRGDSAPALVDLLLARKGNGIARYKYGMTLAHLAVFSEGYHGPKIMEAVLKSGVDPNSGDDKKQTPLHVAALKSTSQTYAIKVLLENGGDPNAIDRDGNSPVHYAAQSHTTSSFMEVLLKYGGNPNAVDIHGKTPLHWAINTKNDAIRLETISLLLEKGGNPNTGDIAGRTPVHYVVCDKRCNSLDVLKLLVEKGGNVSQSDYHDMTPFLLATRTGSEEYCLPEMKLYLTEMLCNMNNVP